MANHRTKSASLYDNKRGAKPVQIKFYLDDERESELYERLKQSPNIKRVMIEALERHFKTVDLSS